MASRTGRPVVVVAHRGPVSLRREAGQLQVTRSPGGLVTAWVGAARLLPELVWVYAADTEEEVHMARARRDSPTAGLPALDLTGPAPQLGQAGSEGVRLAPVPVDPDAHDAFYNQIANPLLWFLQHGLYGQALAPDITGDVWRAYRDGYAAVNVAFADALVDLLPRVGDDPVLMIQDYHFYLLPGLLRQRLPDLRISLFVHIPWPGPDGWRILPPTMREELLDGVLGCDVVAFHTRSYAQSFLLCMRELLGRQVDFADFTVRVGERRVRARSHPLSVDVPALEALVESAETAEHCAELERLLAGRQLLLRVDRTDPSKNIIRGFRAFGQLLEDQPDLVGRVLFLALLQPSRQGVDEYSDYLASIGAVVAEINAKYSADGQQPIDLRLVESLPMAAAAYTMFDALLVNSIADGMNLVAKEAMSVNRRDGVLVLSEYTGAHDDLGPLAVSVHPFDIPGQARAIGEALRMPPAERARRRVAAEQVVRSNDVARWVDHQLSEL